MSSRRGFRLSELVVVLTILATLAALLFPAIQHTRENSRRIQCASNLRQILVGIQQYEAQFRYLPAANSQGFSVHVSILPFIDHGGLYAEFLNNRENFGPPTLQRPVSYFDAHPDAGIDLAIMRCPSDSVAAQIVSNKAATNYAPNLGRGALLAGYDGAFRQPRGKSASGNGPVALHEFLDGTSNTAAIAEILSADGNDTPGRSIRSSLTYHRSPAEFEALCQECQTGIHQYTPYPTGGFVPMYLPDRGRPWFRGWSDCMYTHSLQPNNPSCLNGNEVSTGVYTAYSNHPSGLNVGYVDGQVRSVSTKIDLPVWRAIGSRAGNDEKNTTTK